MKSRCEETLLEDVWSRGGDYLSLHMLEIHCCHSCWHVRRTLFQGPDATLPFPFFCCQATFSVSFFKVLHFFVQGLLSLKVISLIIDVSF